MGVLGWSLPLSFHFHGSKLGQLDETLTWGIHDRYRYGVR